MRLGWWSYLGAFTTSSLLAVMLTPLALRLAVKRRWLDLPSPIKLQRSPVPYLGGLAIVISFSATVVLAVAIALDGVKLPQVSSILGMGVALSLIGLYDDVRRLSPVIRVLAELAASFALWSAGLRIEIFGNTVVDLLLTILWVVGITNAFNLLDNMDGLSAGIATIAATSFFVIAALNGQFLVAGLSAALAGCALGFLRHNFHPARIYMGDAGSLFVGFVLAAIGIDLRFHAPTQVTFLVPILVLGIPIFDTAVVTTTRIAARMSPWTGARDHVSHRLVFVGIPVRAAVALIYLAGAALGWLGIVVARIDVTSAMILGALVFAIAVCLGVLLALIPVHAQSKRKRMMLREVDDHEASVDGHISAPSALR